MSQAIADPAGAGADVADPDVLIIGAGPVGLAAALLIARRGWRVTVLDRHPERRSFLDAIGARVLHVLPADAADAALIRPDHYVFGGVTSISGLPDLVDDRRRQLTGVPSS